MTPAAEIEQVGVRRERHFYAMRVPSLTAWPASLTLASPYFVLLVAGDGATETTEELGQWAARVLGQGLVYACAWGSGCEVVEDAVDWAFLEMPDHRNRPIVMTTFHADESVEAAVEFFVDAAKPADAYLSECSSWLLAEVGPAGAGSGARGHLDSMLSAGT